MTSTRSFKSPGVFAASALTTVPPSPIQGTTYRNPATTLASVNAGWPFALKVDSATFNQILWALSSIVDTVDRRGVPGWSSVVDYDVGAIALGSDNVLYQAQLANGPASSLQDPVSAPTYWAPLRVARTPRVSAYLTAGAFSWTARGYFAKVKQGGGGGGGGGGGTTLAGNAGGSGSGAEYWIATVPGQVYTGVVGAPGAFGATTSGGIAGGTGGTTSFNGVSTPGGAGGAGGGTGGGSGGAQPTGIPVGQGVGYIGNGGAGPSVTSGGIQYGPPGGQNPVGIGAPSGYAGIRADARMGNGGFGGAGSSTPIQGSAGGTGFVIIED